VSAKAPIELRSAAVSDVRFPDRVVELMAVPYDHWTTVEYRGRLIEESFAPGSFGHVRNRTERFLVNLEHELEHVVGRVVDLDADNPEGLRTELFIRRTPEGDQVLDDAADGMLCGSVGFGALPENQEWDQANRRRRITKAYLDHIALTFNPAYRDAKVLAVRSAVPDHPAAARVATPNLDRILAERSRVLYDAIQS
jgi:HK97 family phage prohead protease